VAKYAIVAPVMDERARRLWAATESRAIGYGGDALVSAATGPRVRRFVTAVGKSSGVLKPRGAFVVPAPGDQPSRRRSPA
jgi:hypothetical protein